MNRIPKKSYDLEFYLGLNLVLAAVIFITMVVVGLV
jgi:hypothetical protein